MIPRACFSFAFKAFGAFGLLELNYLDYISWKAHLNFIGLLDLRSTFLWEHISLEVLLSSTTPKLDDSGTFTLICILSLNSFIINIEAFFLLAL